LPEALDMKRPSALSSAMAAMRGTYGSIAMFGMFTSMIGMSLVNPITLVATVGMSSKALRDERKKQLALRRQAARAAGRTAVDEANHLVGKWSRDEVRAAHRRLRDTIAGRVEELQSAADASLASARATVHADDADRRARRHRLETHLAHVQALHRLLAGEVPPT